MGCVVSDENPNDRKDNSDKYVGRSRDTDESDDDVDERKQVEAIRTKRRLQRRPCSLSGDHSLKHYRTVTGNLREDDPYFDARRISVVSRDTDSDSEYGTPLSRQSSLKSSSSYTSDASAGSPAFRKSVSFAGGNRIHLPGAVR